MSERANRFSSRTSPEVMRSFRHQRTVGHDVVDATTWMWFRFRKAVPTESWTAHNARIPLLMLLLCTMLSACGTSPPPQTEQALLENREAYAQGYLDETGERYAAILR